MNTPTKTSGQPESFDFLVFIGRFQPFHLGHLHVIETALKKAKHVIVLCGSAHQPRSVRNPWSIAEREQMILQSISPVESERVHVAPLMDIVYNDESWVRNVQATVNGLVTAHHGTPHLPAKVGLIGHNKDQSSYYLNLFPQWGSVSVNNYNGLNATDIRHQLLASGNEQAEWPGSLPAPVTAQIQQLSDSEAFKNLQQEHEFVQTYRSAWANAPYEPTFVTVDAVVIQSGHVLMVERKARPGKGLLALPGGFIGQSEKLLEACLRELREETRLKVPAPVLKGSIKSQQVFDDPHRSSRGRTITHAFLIELAPNKELPKVKGGDDARHARWVPLADLNPNEIYEDHYFIIQELIGL